MSSTRSTLRRVYLDHNASSPMPEEVREVVLACLGHGWGNPSSEHWEGRRARAAVDRAREQVAALLGVEPEEILFTSGGAESLCTALHGILGAHRAGPPGALALSAADHPILVGAARVHEDRDIPLRWLPLARSGRIDTARAAGLLGPGLALLTVELAHHLTGVVQPIAALAAEAHASGALVHADAVQAFGRIPVDPRRLGADLCSLSSHKIGGPSGAGALWVRRGVRLVPSLPGGTQERGRRAGTENVPGIVGFGAACALARARLADEGARIAALRDLLQTRVLAALPGAVVQGAGVERIPNTLALSLPGQDARELLVALDLEGVAASAGAACSSRGRELPHPLLALGADLGEARGTVRFSLGHGNGEEDVDRAVDALARALGARGRRGN